MKLYIVTLKSYTEVGDTIIKIFSDKNSLNTWLSYADLMEKELFGNNVDPMVPMSKKYRIKESTLDNLDFIQLYADAKGLGSDVKPSQPQ
jgi:hypothetical protein